MLARINEGTGVLSVHFQAAWLGGFWIGFNRRCRSTYLCMLLTLCVILDLKI